MSIAIIGAAGYAGSGRWREALSRGAHASAIGRHPGNRSEMIDFALEAIRHG